MDDRLKELIEFNILEKGDKDISALMTVSGELPSLKGHFPGKPILPAVSIIDISLHLLSQIQTEVSFSNIEVKRSKFMAMVRPNQEVKISAQSDDGQSWRVMWTSTEDESRLAQIQLVI